MAFFRRKIRPAMPPASSGVPPRPGAARPSPASSGLDRTTIAHDRDPAPRSAPGSRDVDGSQRILVVCTANICRSPLGEGLLRCALSARGVAATVSSAGFVSSGLSIDPRSVEYAARVGDDLRDHRPRRLSPDIIRTDGADVILTMGREHLREVANIEPAALRRTFTLREFARRAAATPAQHDDSMADWIARLAAGRRATDLLGDNSPDDIPDPYGRADNVFDSVATEIHDLVASIATAMALVVLRGGER